MALSEQRKKEIDELMKGQSVGGLSDQRRKELDALVQKTSKKSIDTGRNALLDLDVGVMKGALKTGFGAAKLGEKFLGSATRGIVKALTPKQKEEEVLQKLGLSDVPTLTGDQKTSSEALQARIEKSKGLAPGQLTTGVNTPQKIGLGFEQVGEFLAPGAASINVGRAAKGYFAARGASPILQKTAGLASTIGTESALSTGQFGIQEGDIGKNELIAGAISGVSTPVVGKVLTKIGALKKPSEDVIEEANKLFQRATETGAQAPKIKFQNKKGVDVWKVLQEEQIPVGVDRSQAGATIIDGRKTVESINTKLDNLDNVMSERLAQNKEKQFSVRDFFDNYKKSISRSSNLDSTVKKDRIREADRLFKDILEDNSVGMKVGKDRLLSGEELRLKRQSWGKQTAWDATRPQASDVRRNLYFLANDALYKKYDDPILKELNERMSLLAELRNKVFAQKGGTLHGKVIRGGALGRMLQQLGGKGVTTASATIGGVAGGIPGAMVGYGLSKTADEFFSKLAQRKIDPARLSSKAIKQLEKAGILSKTDELILRSKSTPVKGRQLALPKGTGVRSGDAIRVPYTPPTKYEKGAERVSGFGQSPLSTIQNPQRATERMGPVLPPGVTSEPTTPIPLPQKGVLEGQRVLKGENIPSRISTPPKNAIEGQIVEPPVRPQNMSSEEFKGYSEYQNMINRDISRIQSIYTDPELQTVYQTFVSILESTGTKSDAIKKAVLDGDIKAFKKEASKILPKEQVESLLSAKGMSPEEALDVLREKVLIDSPDLLVQ